MPILRWRVVMVVITLVLIGGMIASLFVFRNVLRPSQQQRVIDFAPFMRAFLNQPGEDASIPTVEGNITSEFSIEDLLDLPTATLTSPTGAGAATLTPAETSTPPVARTPTAALPSISTNPPLSPTATIPPALEKRRTYP